jgi:hypothetical protein
VVTEASVGAQVTLAGLESAPNTAIVIAHLINEETGQAEENVALANITLTDLAGAATGITVYGIGVDGNVDPAATATVRNDDGNAAVVLFNVPSGDYLLNYNGGQTDIYATADGAHVTDLYVP